MKVIFARFRRILALFASFWPQKLPNGREEFEIFATKIIKTFDFPDNDSFRNMIAGMIQHAPQTASRLSPLYFGKRIRKAIANEVAFYVMKDLKEKRKLEEEQKTIAAATAPSSPEVVPVAKPQESIQLQGV